MRRAIWICIVTLSVLWAFTSADDYTPMRVVGSVIAHTSMNIVICLAYLAPTFLALHKGNKNATAILALNALAGWLVVGWIGALVWASMAVDRPADATKVNLSRRLRHLALTLFGLFLVGIGVREFGSLEAQIHEGNSLFGLGFGPYLPGWIPVLAGGACLWFGIRGLRQSGFFQHIAPITNVEPAR
jgi:hypothetical protein